MTKASLATAPTDHACEWPAPPIAMNPYSVATEKQFVVSNARAPQPETSSGRLAAAARRIAPSLDYMRAHLDQPITISMLSAMVGLSPSSFFSVFKKVTDDTPLHWFIRARMQRAVELLEQTQLPIKQVANLVGYEDPLYFSRVFKAMHDIPPSEYRAQTKRETANAVAA